MRKYVFHYIVSLLLLAGMSINATSYIFNSDKSQQIELSENNNIEKEAKEIEKQFETEPQVLIQDPYKISFRTISKELDFVEQKIVLPLIHLQLHYPPPNFVA